MHTRMAFNIGLCTQNGLNLNCYKQAGISTSAPKIAVHINPAHSKWFSTFALAHKSSSLAAPSNELQALAHKSGSQDWRPRPNKVHNMTSAHENSFQEASSGDLQALAHKSSFQDYLTYPTMIGNNSPCTKIASLQPQRRSADPCIQSSSQESSAQCFLVWFLCHDFCCYSPTLKSGFLFLPNTASSSPPPPPPSSSTSLFTTICGPRLPGAGFAATANKALIKNPTIWGPRLPGAGFAATANKALIKNPTI